MELEGAKTIMKVLVFGSLNIDYNYSVDHFVQKGETLSSSGLEVFNGGKGLNQSIALAKAGVNVFHAGCVGEDGISLIKELNKAGVDTTYIDIKNTVRTGNAIIQIDSEGDNCIILYGGANQAISREHIDSVMGNFEPGDFLILQNEINEISYIIAKAKENGMVIVLNPSPMDEKIENYPLEYVDYLLLNEIEAAQILGEGRNVQNKESIINRLHKHFPDIKLVLTLGNKGSIYKDSEQVIYQECYKTEIVDTTAAGDTYTGYFIGALLKGQSAKEAMDIASRAAAIAVGRKGASSSIPEYGEVQDSYESK